MDWEFGRASKKTGKSGDTARRSIQLLEPKKAKRGVNLLVILTPRVMNFNDKA